jgi:hypothetical protein
MLKGNAGALPNGIDPSKREQYLSDTDFEKIFAMDNAAFARLPSWKKTTLKKRAGLF